MRKLLSLLVIISTFTLSGMMDANACGDKTLRVGRGIRFYKVFAARHPSVILIYTHAIPLGKAHQLKDYLKKVGHKPHTIDDSAHLSEALKSGQYDLILTDLAGAANLRSQVEFSSSKTAVVPVVYKRSKAEERDAAKQYKVIVKNPTSGDEFLEAVYKVMKSKAQRS